MNKFPLFSVLMANYNNGKFLLTAIESVRQQTYSNWEIIIVDDCSTDNSADIYRQLACDSHIHIYTNDSNRGVGFSKHRAAELASGDIAGVLDPDDTITPDAIEKEVAIHIEHPEVSIIYSKVRYCDTDFNVIREGSLPPFKPGETYFDHRWHGAMNFASFKMSYYRKTEGISPDLRAGDDQDLYFKMEEVGAFYCLDEFTYNYVIKGNGDSLSSFKNYGKQWYGDLKARYQACIRRGLNPDEILAEDLQIVLDSYADAVKGTALKKQAEQIRSSYRFKIGNAILKPWKWLLRR